jgi:hypothetical protein
MKPTHDGGERAGNDRAGRIGKTQVTRPSPGPGAHGLPDLPDELTRLAPWWGFIRRLSGLYFWLALAVLAILVVAAAVLTWLNVQPTGLWRIPFVLGILVLWMALMVALAGWLSRRTE